MRGEKKTEVYNMRDSVSRNSREIRKHKQKVTSELSRIKGHMFLGWKGSSECSEKGSEEF